VCAVSEGIFEVDAARLLRAVRLAAELDFTIEPQTELLIHRYSQYMAKVPGERVREELLRLFRLPQCAQQLRYLDSLGLLLAVVPELKEGKTVEPPGLYFENVFHHSLETVAALQFLIRENDWEYGNRDILAVTPWADFVAGHLSEDFSSEMSRLAGLKIAALLHDIAKPKTKFVDASGKMHFYGHAKEGAEMAADILRRLRFSNREISLIKCLIYHHLRPAQLIGKELPTRRAIYRYFRDTGDAGIDILFLALADYLATCGPLVDMEQWGEYCWLASYIVAEHAVPARATPPKLINGHDVINLFGLKPGPLIGKLLDMVREAQASGEISTKEEAIALLQKELESHALSRS
jgi:poly(A) polymerase